MTIPLSVKMSRNIRGDAPEAVYAAALDMLELTRYDVGQSFVGILEARPWKHDGDSVIVPMLGYKSSHFILRKYSTTLAVGYAELDGIVFYQELNGG